MAQPGLGAVRAVEAGRWAAVVSHQPAARRSVLAVTADAGSHLLLRWHCTLLDSLRVEHATLANRKTCMLHLILSAV